VHRWRTESERTKNRSVPRVLRVRLPTQRGSVHLTSITLRSAEVGNLELKGDLTGTFAFPEVVSRREGERPRGTSSERLRR